MEYPQRDLENPLSDKVLEIINTNRFYNERVLEVANTKDEVYVIFDTENNKLANVGAVKKIADYIAEHDDQYYLHWIDWNVSEVVQITKPLSVFVFHSDEIKGYTPIKSND